MPLSDAKIRNLDALSTSQGVIAALAMDQRRSLRGMMAAAARLSPEQVTNAQVSAFKTAVTRYLSPHASAILLDPDYGLGAAGERSDACGLLLAYEADGYENPRPHKMLALQPRLSVRRLAEMGAQGVKILLTYTPFDDEAANDEKKALVERIGAECSALGLPFFLEPVGYDPGGADLRGLAYARSKPEIVIRSMEEFSQPRYQVDVLKVEFPVNAMYVAGSPVWQGDTAQTHTEALAYFRAADRTAKLPYIYLSAGVSTGQFLASLELAREAGSRFSGVLCGRATWQDGIPAFMQGGDDGLAHWLQTEGVQRIGLINKQLQDAVAWQTWSKT